MYQINEFDHTFQMKNSWLDKSEYPFVPNYHVVNGQNMHYIDEGEGEIVMFVHGTPTWSFDYRNVIRNLITHYRCIAIDHIGFGLSDKPEKYNYSTQNHSETLARFILEKQFDNITLVVHDFGGPIGLNFAIQFPDKIKRLVILNSWLWSSRSDPDYIKLSRILKSPLLPFLYRYLNFSPNYILPKSFGDIKLPKRIRRHYSKPFANRTQRNGALAFARSLLNDQEWFEELWEKRTAISNKPTLFIWGMKDPVIKPQFLEKFEGGFTNSVTIKMMGSGHFPQEEQPDIVIKAMLDFLAKDSSN